MYVVGVQIVVLQGEEEDTGLGSHDVVRDNFIKLPGDVGDALQDGVPPLLRMDQDAVVLVNSTWLRRWRLRGS